MRALLRPKEPAWQALGLDDEAIGDEALIAHVARHPELMNRPIVVTPRGAPVPAAGDGAGTAAGRLSGGRAGSRAIRA